MRSRSGKCRHLSCCAITKFIREHLGFRDGGPSGRARGDPAAVGRGCRDPCRRAYECEPNRPVVQASSGHSANPRSSARKGETSRQSCRRLRTLTARTSHNPGFLTDRGRPVVGTPARFFTGGGYGTPGPGDPSDLRRCRRGFGFWDAVCSGLKGWTCALPADTQRSRPADRRGVGGGLRGACAGESSRRQLQGIAALVI